jgi:alanine racemase
VTRPLQIQIDLGNIAANARLARELAPQGRLIGCVKADAYGHGMLKVAKVLAPEVDAFGVACLDEAKLLRNAGSAHPILLLEGCFSADELHQASSLDCWVVLHSQEQLEIYCDAEKASTNIWLKLDTGMHRLGFEPSSLVDVLARLHAKQAAPNIHLMTHFACADETSNDFTRHQLDQFTQAAKELDYPTSLANSAGLLAWPEARSDWNRPGFMLYGVNPLDIETPDTPRLKPAMSMFSEIISVRDLAAGEGVGYNHAWRADSDSRIAVVACGYGDGYPRQARNGTPVLVNGQMARTVGHIAMDMMMLDVTGLPKVSVGDKVELWGKNLSIADVARHSDMSPYELMTRLPPRAPRIYL